MALADPLGSFTICEHIKALGKECIGSVNVYKYKYRTTSPVNRPRLKDEDVFIISRLFCVMVIRIH